MRRRVNIPWLIGLLAASVLLGLGFYLLHGFQARRHAQSLLERTDQAEEQGDKERLSRYLERYLVLYPEDHQVLARYGLVLAQQADSPAARNRALAALARVLRRSPERNDLRRRRIMVAMDLGDYAAARDDLTILVEKTPNDGELEMWLGQCHQALGDSTNAAAWFTQAIEHAPGQIDSYQRLARLLRQNQADPERADQVMNDLITANEKSAEAYLARARYRAEFHTLESAAEDLAKARELAPEQIEVLLASGQVAAAQGKFDQALNHLKQARELGPDQASVHVILAAVQQQAGRHAEAIASLRRGAQAVPEASRREVLLSLLDLLIQGNEIAEAEEVLARLRAPAEGGQVPVGALLDFHEARILNQKGQWARAVALLQRVRPQLAQSRPLSVSVELLLGECCGRLGDAEQQLHSYRSAVAHDADSSRARLQLGTALLARGDAASAVNEFRQMMTLRGAPASGWALLARALIVHNVQLPAGERNWPEVAQILDRAAQAGSSEVPLLRTAALAAQGQGDRAFQLLKEARDQHPDRVDLWLALIDWVDQQGKPEDADALMREAQQKLASGGRQPPVELTQMQVRRLARRAGGVSDRSSAAARQELQRHEQELEKSSAGDQEQLLGTLAEAYLRIGDTGSAERLWSRLAQMQPNNLGVRLILFDLALQTKKEDALPRLLGELKRIEGPDGTWWRYGEAVGLIARAAKEASGGRQPSGELDQARALLAEVARHRPTWSRLHVAEAEISDLEGHPDQALERYQKAVDLGERQPAVVGRLVQLLVERQRFGDADRVIRKLQEGSGLPTSMNPVAAEIALHAQDPDRALDLARQVAAQKPGDARSQLWLGLSQWAKGLRPEAEASLRRAVELADTAPENWLALVQFLARTGQTAQAEAAVRGAQNKLPADKAALALGQCYEALGQRDRAEPYFQAALKNRPGDVGTLRMVASFYLRGNQFAQAEPILHQILEPSSKAPAGDLAWARRNVAMGLASRGNYRQFREALALIERNQEGTQADPVADRYARALILAKRPCHQREAAGELEKLAVRQLLSEEDQFLLVQLLEAQGNAEGADRQLTSLLAAYPDNRLYLAHQARRKLQSKDSAGAQRILDRLEKLDPQSWEAVEIRARMQKDPAGLLEQFVARDSSDPDRAGRAAVLLEELGQLPAAEKMYRTFAAQSKAPESVLALARFLGRQQRVAEGLDLCERAWQNCRPEAVAAASVALARAGQADARHAARVERWLEAAIQKSPDNGVLLALADCRDLQGRYDEAEKLYRQVLARDRDNVAALNNLAWLLARRPDQASEALDLINRAIDLFGPEASLLDTRGVVGLAAGQNKQALDDLRQALAQRSAPAYSFHFAQVHLQNQEPEAAREAFHQAQAAGLTADKVHPLERAAFRELLAEVGAK